MPRLLLPIIRQGNPYSHKKWVPSDSSKWNNFFSFGYFCCLLSKEKIAYTNKSSCETKEEKKREKPIITSEKWTQKDNQMKSLYPHSLTPHTYSSYKSEAFSFPILLSD